jgi:two-component system, cell cycle sensor histidine kinase and response regulator CckA
MTALTQDLASKHIRRRRFRSVLAAALAVPLAAGAAALMLVFGPVGPGSVAVTMGAGGLVGAAVAAILVALPERRRALLFERTLDAFADPAFVLGPKGEIVHANKAITRTFEGSEIRPIEALLRRTANPDSQKAIEHLVRAAQDGKAAEAEIPVETNTSVEWYRLTTEPLPQTPGYALWRLEDITSRRQIEQTVREEQARLVDFLENAPMGFYSVDESGRFRLVNAIFAEWLGVSTEDLLAGQYRLHDFAPAAGAAEAAPHDPFGSRDAMPEGAIMRGEVTLKPRSGPEFRALITQTMTLEQDGQGLRTRSVVRDLTPEIEIAKAIQRSEQHFQRFFEDAPIGIALVDAGFHVTHGNAAFRDMVVRCTGETGEVPLGRPLTELASEATRVEFGKRLAQASVGEGDGPIEMRFRGRAQATVAIFASRRVELDGSRAGLILHFLDMTEQRKLEQQFVQSQKMQAIGQLAGGIAHDFNNLLTAMIGFCDLLLLRHPPADPSFADVMQIKQNASRAANLVRQLLAFSRQQTLQAEVINVTDELAELAHLLRRLIGANVELVMVHARDIGLVKVDRGQLHQVIINLAVNARDAMAGGGSLNIRTSNRSLPQGLERGNESVPAGEYVAIEVADTGTGIPGDILDRIFEPFFTTKEVGAGTGLGLSTVYGILKQTGGFIFVDSTLGKGTNFTILLPRLAADAQVSEGRGGEEAKSKPSDLTGAGTLMLVEDEDAVRMFSARALRNKGYKVIEASSGEQALELLGKLEGGLDLLITDIVMPKLDGPTLIKAVRKDRPTLRVICISGYAEDTFRSRLSETANVDFLPKPFTLNQLAAKVKETMSRPIT